jgi:hypothetical protein
MVQEIANQQLQIILAKNPSFDSRFCIEFYARFSFQVHLFRPAELIIDFLMNVLNAGAA